MCCYVVLSLYSLENGIEDAGITKSAFSLISSQEIGMNIVGIPLVKSTHYGYYKKYLWPPEVAKWQCSHCMHHKNDIFNNARWGTRPQLLFL